MKLLTNIEVADMLGIKPNTLEIWRLKGKGPKFKKMGKEKQAPIRYDEAQQCARLVHGRSSLEWTHGKL